VDEKYKDHGAFSWFELMTSDPGAAKEFYTKLFGWSFEDMPMGPGTYSVIKVKGQSEGTAGLMATPPEAQGTPPMWSIYITVDDVDATAKLTQELGGKVLVPPRDIPKVGRFCVIQDPQGAVICPISYLEM
jgi:predicted enzyme related to lactoylglutathione lyase